MGSWARFSEHGVMFRLLHAARRLDRERPVGEGLIRCDSGWSLRNLLGGIFSCGLRPAAEVPQWRWLLPGESPIERPRARRAEGWNRRVAARRRGVSPSGVFVVWLGRKSKEK